jgi:hypothetical protein
MQLSKSLLQAILIGVTLGTASSCNLIEELDDNDLQTPRCGTETGQEKPQADPNAAPGICCPACGMG